MAVTIEQSPLGQVLAQGIRDMPGYLSQGYQRNLQERQHQLSVDQFAEQQKLNQLQLMEMQDNIRAHRKLNLMDAGGYENPMITKFFSNLQYGGGTFKANSAIPGGQVWTGTPFMSRDDARKEYEKILRASGREWNDQDAQYFEQHYEQAKAAETNKIWSELTTLQDSGYSDDDILYILSQGNMITGMDSFGNPTSFGGNKNLSDAIQSIYSDNTTTKEMKAFLQPYLKTKAMSTSEIVANALEAGAGTAMGIGAAGATERWWMDPKLKEAWKATDTGTDLTASKDDYKKRLDKAKEAKKKHQKYYKKRKKTKNYRNKLNRLSSRIKTLTDKYDTAKTTASKSASEFIKKNRWSSKAFQLLKKPFPATMATSLASSYMGDIGKKIGGTRGQAYGQFGGAALQAGMGGAAAWRGLKGAFNVGKNLLWRAPVAVGGALTDLHSPLMDIAMATWLLSGVKDDWNEAWKTHDRAKAGF